tara:strand:- start:4993 stop:5637 length:645 start_codon:yes stop_codon:yes gene_type:complete
MTIQQDQFWSASTVDPKRSYRWILLLNKIPTYVIKTAGKPSFTIEGIQHQFVSHTFHYPGRIQWNELNITLVDPVFPDASAIVVKTLQASGYAIPGKYTDAKRSFSKKDGVKALGVPQMEQIDATGNVIERWTLQNCWLSAVNFGELTYESDSMINVQLTLRYDWAEYEGQPDPKAALPIPESVMTNGMDQPSTITNYQTELGLTRSPSAGLAT